MSKRTRFALVPALVLGSAMISLAGGFWISIQNPSTIKDAAAKNAVVLVRVDGCHNPADAAVTGTAEGVVDGQRRSIPLKLVPVAQPGTYAVEPQWPADGVWVLAFRGKVQTLETGTLVRLTPGKFEKQSTELLRRKITAEDIDRALKAL
jgi:hypothetical protein